MRWLCALVAAFGVFVLVGIARAYGPAPKARERRTCALCGADMPAGYAGHVACTVPDRPYAGRLSADQVNAAVDRFMNYGTWRE